ncbi:hypothetical protein NXG27_12105 [Megasphaera paucivorans]|uniref:Uncharacterized protein n=1 Tax=Megasphaera paucivorans TaxID=349095 RepID=A0A1G9S3I4_9FIRM|nr:hypothetical protein [Megasphaera paucivorans]SDM29305.1 hypothetical protein SAMN05660299_00600 [Megasphaera paucivorans]
MDSKEKKINIGIGFVTGRKNFKNVIKMYVHNWKESGLIHNDNIGIHLFIAYDLHYTNTVVNDYTITDPKILEMMDSIHYLNNTVILSEIETLVKKNIVTLEEAELIFGEGYAMKRNAVLYFAIKKGMDYLVFFDDDEYPIANIKMNNTILWKGENVLLTHIQNLKYADITHGYHCGYISPMPQLEFNSKLSENDFRIFIEAVSNDIINWQSVKTKMEDGGITYADVNIKTNNKTIHVKETNGMKFISGSNLGFNLTKIDKIFPFYNPPGARGEDTFLSTCICNRVVKKIPCYTFHDSFLSCEQLLFGSLPGNLKSIKIDPGTTTQRFLKVAIGWIRYKPLLLYVTQNKNYENEIALIREKLKHVVPCICNYFNEDKFELILDEFDYFHLHVKKHYEDFKRTQVVWLKLINVLKQSNNK